MPRGAVALLERPEGRALVEEHCRRYGVPLSALEALLEAVIDRGWMMRAAGLWDEFDEILEGIEPVTGLEGDNSTDVPPSPQAV